MNLGMQNDIADVITRAKFCDSRFGVSEFWYPCFAVLYRPARLKSRLWWI